MNIKVGDRVRLTDKAKEELLMWNTTKKLNAVYVVERIEPTPVGRLMYFDGSAWCAGLHEDHLQLAEGA